MAILTLNCGSSSIKAAVFNKEAHKRLDYLGAYLDEDRMHPHDAEHFNVEDGDLVNVSIDGDGRDLTFGDLLIRVSENFRLEMHIDTDEANAAGVQRHHTGVLERTSNLVRVTKKTISQLGVTQPPVS